MSWPEFPRSIRLLAALGLAALVAGCFQPMYGDRALVGGGAAGSGIGSKLASVEVEQINAPQGTRLARLGVSVRDELIFALTGGSAPAAPNYRLKVNLSSTNLQVIVDINTARPDIQNYGIDSSFTLTDVTTGKVVVNGTTFSRVSYNIPGQQQRFAGDRGLRDAENRAASVIVENIRNRLASYFVAGT
ncbi:MAG: LPS assembly lipoprotein LptE [Pseudolabrys sp.]|nr:LPS assembly lipoprotein LptE [Pseudolabrys sp.]